MVDNKVCWECGKSFRPNNANQVYCNKNCRIKAYYQSHRKSKKEYNPRVKIVYAIGEH